MKKTITKAVRLTERQRSFLITLMQNLMDVSHAASVRQDAKRIWTKLVI